MKNRSFLFAILAGIFTTSGGLQAQVITWSTSVPGLGNADTIATNGTYFDALSTHIVTDTTPTTVTNSANVSTVFNAFAVGTLSDGTITMSNSGGYGSDGSNDASSPYDSVLNGCTFVQDATGAITIAGLTSGEQYQIQLWNVQNDPTRQTEFYEGTVADSVSFYNGSVIGTFTASGTSETIDFTNAISGGAGEVNAVDVRQVPEPSTYALLFVGAGALFLFARRRVTA